MKLFAKSALCAAIATSVFTVSAQAEITTTDPSFKLTYKNYFWKQKDTAGEPKYYRDEWVQALVADIDTGYVNDIIGAVITAGATNTFHAKKGTSISNIAVGGDGKYNDIGGFQQAFLKAKYQLSGVDLKGSHGVKKRSYELYGNSGSRILLGSSYGSDASVQFKDLTLYGSNITGASNRNESKFHHDLTIDGKDTKVQILGAQYSIAGVGLTGEQLIVKDYLKKHFAKVDYTFDFGEGRSLDTDIRYGKAVDDGGLYNGKLNSSYVNLNATYNFNNAYVGFGYNKVSGDDWNDSVGDQGNAGTFNSSLSQWADYDTEGEQAYLITAGYNFADQGLPGLSIDAYAAKGSDSKTYGSDFDRNEWSTYVSYSFDGKLKGLSIAWLHVNYNFDGTALKDIAGSDTKKGDVEKSRDTSNRFYLKYSVAVF
ncbi:OprD family porin [Endozoicomonas euniceicola]|uniref:OprD family porin n=1 Tax=Endozoicomonas euniceicola TaxID=1234143 RepID=A0ABY6GMJ7_9GAMM|nr:OprD family porin [Endozoicomonas euniceicola]UYM13945.1 OprD family porin [Endozoicomonas euniceicola]